LAAVPKKGSGHSFWAAVLDGKKCIDGVSGSPEPLLGCPKIARHSGFSYPAFCRIWDFEERQFLSRRFGTPQKVFNWLTYLPLL
jgi:hypothetical protein